MKALNRKEVLVNAKANGTLDSFKPLTRDEAFTKKALGLGGGASSWNNLTDKPFGKMKHNGSVYNGSISCQSRDESGIYWSDDMPCAGELIANESYTVTYKGVSYNIVCEVDDRGWYLLGDPACENYPFFVYSDRSMVGFGAREESTDIITIDGKYSTIVPIDSQFLPPLPVATNFEQGITRFSDVYQYIEPHFFSYHEISPETTPKEFSDQFKANVWIVRLNKVVNDKEYHIFGVKRLTISVVPSNRYHEFSGVDFATGKLHTVKLSYTNNNSPYTSVEIIEG